MSSIYIVMTYDECVDCGKAKSTRSAQRSAKCISCVGKCRTYSSVTIEKMIVSQNVRRVAEGRVSKDVRKWPGIISWANRVKQRDNHKCQVCNYQGTKGKKDVDAHHILWKSQFPALALMMSNGITLCKTCHWSEHTSLPAFGWHLDISGKDLGGLSWE